MKLINFQFNLKVADKGLKKLQMLHPFDPSCSEAPRKWTKEEDKKLEKAVCCSVSNPLISNVTRKLDGLESEPTDKIALIKSQMKNLRDKSDRDLIGGRNEAHDWEAISVTSMGEKRSAVECEELDYKFRLNSVIGL